MEEEGAPLSVEKLWKLLGIRKADREILGRRLNAMERDGQILRNRKDALCIAEKLNLIPGKVQGHPDGFGFLIPDAGGDDLFLSPKEMAKVLHGDRAMVRQSGVDRRGRPEGKIIEVLERANNKLVGRLIRERGVVLVAAEDRRINQDILIEPGRDMGAQAGQVVMVELIEQPSVYAQPIGKVIEISAIAPIRMEIEITRANTSCLTSSVRRKNSRSLPQDRTEEGLEGRVDW